MKKGILLLPLSTVAFAGDYQIHVLNEGDTLSQLLKDKGYTPLYGKDNWVEKTLKLNHLTEDQTRKIKKGLPIILPKKAEVEIVDVKELEKDFVSVQNSSIMRKGIFGNTISEHQDLLLELDYYSNSVILKNSNLTLNENYGLGMQVKGKNNYSIGPLTYNYNGSAFIYTHGNGQFDKYEDFSASYLPSYSVESHIEIQSPQIAFNFGPTLTLEERSRVYEKDESLNIRRDRAAWMGFRIDKFYEVDHLNYQTVLGYKRKIMQQSLNDKGVFAASTVYASAKVNLTHDYDFSLKASTTQYNNIGITGENSLGFNFSYNLK